MVITNPPRNRPTISAQQADRHLSTNRLPRWLAPLVTGTSTLVGEHKGVDYWIYDGAAPRSFSSPTRTRDSMPHFWIFGDGYIKALKGKVERTCDGRWNDEKIFCFWFREIIGHTDKLKGSEGLTKIFDDFRTAHEKSLYDNMPPSCPYPPTRFLNTNNQLTKTATPNFVTNHLPTWLVPLVPETCILLGEYDGADYWIYDGAVPRSFSSPRGTHDITPYLWIFRDGYIRALDGVVERKCDGRWNDEKIFCFWFREIFGLDIDDFEGSERRVKTFDNFRTAHKKFLEGTTSSCGRVADYQVV